MYCEETNYSMKDNIKYWHMENYPADNMGYEINKEITFYDLLYCLDYSNECVYDFIGVHDSWIREKIFNGLSVRMGVGYNVIYDKWLNNSKKRIRVEIVEDEHYLRGTKQEILQEDEIARRFIKSLEKVSEVKLLDGDSYRNLMLNIDTNNESELNTHFHTTDTIYLSEKKLASLIEELKPLTKA